MSDSARKLSFSTLFNQQKIVLNTSATPTVPTSGVGADTVYSVATGLTYVPTFRVGIEKGGVMYRPGYFNLGLILGIDYVIFGIDASFNFFIRTYNTGAAVSDITFYIRIYEDGAP